ncbi:hypothetical protein BpHYR1_031849, partial [Brachionus plicatilis]
RLTLIGNSFILRSILPFGEALTDQDIIGIVQKNNQNCDDEVEVVDQEPVSCDLELLSKIKERMSDLRLSSLNQTHIEILMTL